MDPEGVLELLGKTFLSNLFLNCPVASATVQVTVVLDVERPLLVRRAEARILKGGLGAQESSEYDVRMRSHV